MWLRFGLAGVSVLPFAVMLSQAGQGNASQPKGDFAKEVVPIFRAHCYSCHKGESSAAGLDLSSIKGITKGGLSGKLFVSGKPDSSLLMKRVLGQGGMPAMPMGFAPLTKTQLASLRAWIAGGAKMAEAKAVHWAYRPPVAKAAPKVKNAAWVKNPIDAYILSKLEKAGMQPSPQASKEMLLRRVTLDLTGLPPTLAELDAFLADKSANAYEKVVDRLLASPRFGERQAMIWLDLARYADSNGYEADYMRTAWKYRDWVIQAFNKNLSYRQFTIDQLAGDLLPKPNLEQLIATGFHRNTMLNLEGGVDPKEARYEMINDRVATTSQVWLGQTMQCARCHDHKYDPISHKDYFRMYAIFANTDYESRGDPKVGQEKYYEFSVPAPSAEQSQEKLRIEKALAQVRAEFNAETPDYLKKRSEFIEAARRSNPWSYVELDSPGLSKLPDFALKAPVENPATVVYRVRFAAKKGMSALRIRAYADASLTNKGPGRSSSGNFILSRLTLKSGNRQIPIDEFAASYVQNGYSLSGLTDSDGNTGWAVAPQFGREHWLIAWLKTPLEADTDVVLELGHESPSWPQHSLGNFNVQPSYEPNRAIQKMPEHLLTAIGRNRESEVLKEIDAYYRSVSPELAPVRERERALAESLAKLNSQIPMAMVMRETRRGGPLQAPFHARGEFLQPGEPVTAGIPAAFGTISEKRVDRLALAKWLVSPSNPMSARVEVNRIWEQYFGRGIVETSENWGTPGTPPTHPELLDWLAVKFMNSGWDMKAMHRLIVTSATYRQSSRTSAAAREKDPQNRYFARGPRYRMPAEMIRDNALQIAGLLSPKIGGPSVFPHQPDGVWNTPYSGERWQQSSGEDLYRRGLYTFWKRTATYPAFVNFDAPSREMCTIRREPTNTPLQALNLLNDPAFLEAAKAFAKRTEDIKDVRARITVMFRACTARRPKADELTRLELLLANLQQKVASPEGSTAVVPWTMLASVLLNLDETITKE